MTDDERLLLKAVIDHPDDDAPRLAYAEWCDRSGDPRGRFIRVQLELAKVEFKREDPNRRPLLSESRRLLNRHGQEWMPNRHPHIINCEMHRGFVAGVTMNARSFLEHFADLRASYPIQLMTIRDMAQYARSVLISPYLQQLSSLSAIRGNITDEDIKAFSQSPFVANIWWLGLSSNLISQEGVEALITSPFLKKLGFVWLEGNPCNPIETAGFDQGCLVDKQMPEVGRNLEARFGPIAWLRYRDNSSPLLRIDQR